MKYAVLTAGALLLAASGVSYAQTNTTVPGYPGVKVEPVAEPSAAVKAEGTGIRQKLSADLVKAGFSNVTIVPEAFIVQAKNKAGEPVTMFISPDSMTVFTTEDAKGKATDKAPESATKQ
jgi:hypothetical protein